MKLFSRLCEYIKGISARGRQRVPTTPKSDETGRLTTVRKNIEVSERVLYYAEKNCKLAENRFAFGEADATELSDARASFARAKIFFTQSLRDLQSALVELEGGGHA